MEFLKNSGLFQIPQISYYEVMKSILNVFIVLLLLGLCSIANAHRDHRLGPHGGIALKLKTNILEIVPFENQYFHVFVLDKKEKDVDLKTVTLSAVLSNNIMKKTIFICSVFEEANFKCETKENVTLETGSAFEFTLTTLSESKAGAVAKKGTQSGKLELPFEKHFPQGHH